jgi:hypothetical protein
MSADPKWKVRKEEFWKSLRVSIRFERDELRVRIPHWAFADVLVSLSVSFL